MPSPRKKQIAQASRKRQRRGTVYLVAIVIIITTIGIGWYVYASSQSSPNTLPDIVYAKVSTSQGPMEFELYHSLTPKTVENFVSLAQSGFYNNLVWHRISHNFVIQTGNSNTKNGLNNSTWNQPGSGQSIPFEYASSLHNAVAYVAMASTGKQVGGTTQFYININDNSGPAAQLDGNYAVFGKVISGMDAAYRIGSLPVYYGLSATDGQPVNPADAMLNSVVISNSP